MLDNRTFLPLRFRRRARSRQTGSGRFGLLVTLVLSLLAASVGITLALGFVRLTSDLPTLEILEQQLSPPNGYLLTPTRIYDRSGEKLLLSLENPAAVGRQYVFIESNGNNQISSTVISTTLATADPGFWQHPGFSLSSLTNHTPQTLAERLVWDFLLRDEQPGLRKNLRGRLLAAQLTRTYGRNQILEWYLNSANYGRLAYGIDAAARVYFDKSASQLNLAEAALLAAIPSAPAINPLDTLQASLERQNEVLNQVEATGFAETEKIAEARNTKLNIRPPATWADQPAPEFVQQALRPLSDAYGWDYIERGGLRILTTLDYDLQAQSTCALNAQLYRLSTNQGDSSPQPTATGTDCAAARLLPTLSLPQKLSPEDLAAHTILYDPSNGQVLAYTVGGATNSDTALSPGRPPGTLLTPLVYLTGFARGQSPATLVWDIPGQVDSPTAEIPSFDEEYQGPLRLRYALANDDLGPAVQSYYQSGSINVWRTIRQLGISTLTQNDEDRTHAVLWEAGQATLLELTQAYGILANNGVQAGYTNSLNTQRAASLTPGFLLSVEFVNGEKLLDFSKPAYRPVVTQQLAYLLTHTLSDEPARWRSLGHPNPLEIGRPAAAKIGQTLDGQDGWTVGYTPNLVASVWIGSPSANPENLLPQAASALWHAVLQYASQGYPARGWSTPPGITTMDVCDPSGLLPTPECSNIVSEVFASGSEPTQTDNLYQTLYINRETGLLATINTPPELVEGQVFLFVPPEAQEWARLAGLPTPPENYDVVSKQFASPDGLAITSPEQFDYLSGEVKIRGSAGGQEVVYYRLQAGAGLNPQTWLQIGENETRQVRDSILGTWDTTGLNGLYVIQLLSVDKDQRIETTAVQVTVDNIPPVGTIIFPVEGQNFDYPLITPVLLQVEASDNLELDSVEFIVDGQKLTSAAQPPYIYAWEGGPGEHKLTVRLRDRAGNVTELKTTFQVKR
jgi:membrane peptidoglycan carboxypeptidase